MSWPASSHLMLRIQCINVGISAVRHAGCPSFQNVAGVFLGLPTWSMKKLEEGRRYASDKVPSSSIGVGCMYARMHVVSKYLLSVFDKQHVDDDSQ
jgi:hypothetical protein